jgi:apoptosis-inducing factor 3
LRAQTATGLELDKRRIVLDGGKDSLVYDKLVIATGGVPRRLPIPGADLENVFTFRGVEDAKKVDAGKSKGLD